MVNECVSPLLKKHFAGWGRYCWNDGRVFSGQWVANRMHGYGVFHWPDGRSYKGQYDHVRKDSVEREQV